MLDLNWYNPMDIDILDHEFDPRNTCGLDLLVYKVREDARDSDELISSQFVPFNSIVRAVRSQVRVGSAPMQVFKTNLKAQQGEICDIVLFGLQSGRYCFVCCYLALLLYLIFVVVIW